MRVPRSVVVVRLACLSALAVSAALVAESLHPERGFCPLHAACEKARQSAAGNLLGVPTSVVGILAFAALFALTLLPPRAARLLARPAAWTGAVIAGGLVAYQALVLGSFCPLCLIVDASALAAGAGAFGWPPVPRGFSGLALEDEHLSVRLRWALAAGVAFVTPLAWPAPAPKPGWVEIPEAARAEVDPEPEPAAGVAETEVPELPRLEVPTGGWNVAAPKFDEYREPATPPLHADTDGAHATTASASVDRTGGSEAATAAPRTASAASPPPTASDGATAPARPAVHAVPMVMYLNPFCAHCRATHARLEAAVAELRVPARIRYVYVWTKPDVPDWAWACALGASMGIEDRVFGELLRARDDGPDEVRAAEKRAGLDPAAVTAATGRADVRARLARDRRSVFVARVEGIPTLDVGRRRLMGEQTQGELIDALQAALAR